MLSFSEAFEQHMDDVYAFLAYRIGSRADAEDLTQATFERAYRAWGRYDPKRASVKTWLIAIAGNLLIDHYRSAVTRLERPLDGDPGMAAPPDELELGMEPAVASALALLDDRQREVIALRFGGDLSGSEIAETLGLSLANAQQILSRALRRLRGELEGPAPPRRGGGEPL